MALFIIIVLEKASGCSIFDLNEFMIRIPSYYAFPQSSKSHFEPLQGM
jgi:hypothetical protein